jgi:N-acetylglucosaminyldiphosphoundecaprenol N-acetyl-beta-D-mannosaminyltransferase
MTPELLPRARLADVVMGKTPLVGSRLDPAAPRGLVSPVESRVHLGIPYGDLVEDEARYLREHDAAKDAGVVLRALIASALAQEEKKALAAPRIVSAKVHNLSIDEALDAIFEPTGDRRRARVVHFVHPHALNLAAFDAEHAERLARADKVLPDGIGIRIAASILGVSMRHNLNGTDLLPLLCRRAVAEGVHLALIGAAPGVAEQCAQKLIEGSPGLSIPVISHGFLANDEAKAIAAKIEALGRTIVLVGMGSPLQERFAWEHLAHIPQATVITVGGLFDFFSGRVPRAPLAWRELGLEWLFRLLQEPRRLAKRYLVGNPLFLALAVKQRLFGAPVE